MLYFFEKNWKIAAALEAPPPNPIGLRRLGAPPPTPRVVTPITCYIYFLEGVCSANVISYCQKGLKGLKIAIIFYFAAHFLL